MDKKKQIPRVLVIGNEASISRAGLSAGNVYEIELAGSLPEALQKQASSEYARVIIDLTVLNDSPYEILASPSLPRRASDDPKTDYTPLRRSSRFVTHLDPEEALFRQGELLQGIIDNIPVLLCIWDASLQQFHFNQHLRKVLGYTEEDTLDGNFMSKVYPDAEYRQSVIEYMQSLERGWRDLKTTARDGSVIDISWTNIYLSDESFIGIGIDIRDRKRAEQQQRGLLEREHHIAEVLQQAVMPPEVPSEVLGYRIGAVYRPAMREAEIGGDFYDVFELADGKLAVLIGDVAGKGLQAALRVASARHAIRSYAYLDPRPGRVMTLANEALCRDTGDESQILTAFFAILDPEGGTFAYSCAGHEPPVIRRPDGECIVLDPDGLPLGLMEGVEYGQSTRRLDLGDIVVMVTDGITEARAPGPELFGSYRLIDFLCRDNLSSPHEIASEILEAATHHAGGELQDDAAVVVFTPYTVEE